MEDLRSSITVSFLALFVIFITLAILIGVIKILVAWMPYVDPPPSETKKKVHPKKWMVVGATSPFPKYNPCSGIIQIPWSS